MLNFRNRLLIAWILAAVLVSAGASLAGARPIAKNQASSTGSIKRGAVLAIGEPDVGDTKNGKSQNGGAAGDDTDLRIPVGRFIRAVWGARYFGVTW